MEGPTGEPPLMAIRSLAAHCEDGHWSWHEWGTVQPFERPERYEARLKRDRLDRPLLVEYLNALGIHVDHDGYFGRGWVVHQHVDWHVRRESVEEFPATERMAFVALIERFRRSNRTQHRQPAGASTHRPPPGIISRATWAEVARGRASNDGDSVRVLCGELAKSFGDRVDGRFAGGDIDHEIVNVIVAGA